ncbi:SDR family NAD(P)-dependent oxidoreductase [Kribbella swartbergensis]
MNVTAAKPLTGSVALVTGAASGIGRATAGLLAQRGAGVVAVDLTEAGANAIAEQLRDAGAAATAQVGDVSQADDCDRVVRHCVEAHGRLDILVHCAGIGGGNATVLEMDEQAWRRTLDVNATGTFLINRAAAGPMTLQRYGRIVNVASIAGLEGNPRASHYSASKGAVIAFTKALGKELATTGVLVNAIAPAVIATEMLSQVTDEQLQFMLQKIPMGRPGQPSEAAELAAFLASPQLSFSTGAVFDLSGGRAVY